MPHDKACDSAGSHTELIAAVTRCQTRLLCRDFDDEGRGCLNREFMAARIRPFALDTASGLCIVNDNPITHVIAFLERHGQIETRPGPSTRQRSVRSSCPTRPVPCLASGERGIIAVTLGIGITATRIGGILDGNFKQAEGVTVS